MTQPVASCDTESALADVCTMVCTLYDFYCSLLLSLTPFIHLNGGPRSQPDPSNLEDDKQKYTLKDPKDPLKTSFL